MNRFINNPFKPFMLLLLLMAVLGGIYSPTAIGAAPMAATTWDGSTSTDWNTASNWSTDSVPTASDAVTIADVANDPVIGNGTTALATNVIVNSGAVLTVNSGGTLTIDGNGASLDGIKNNGTLTNEGTINIDDFGGGFDEHGIYNDGGTFNNQNNGVINIGTLGATNNIAGDGIQNHSSTSSFTNSSGSTITIKGVGHRGIFARLGSFTNEGTISIDTTGHAVSAGDAHGQALYNDGTFNNQNNGQIDIDKSGAEGIYNNNTFTNQTGGTINIGTQGGATNITNEGIDNRGDFTNGTGSTVTIKDVNGRGILIAGTSNSFINQGTIAIDNTGDDGVFVDNPLTNKGALNIGLSTGNVSNQALQLNDTYIVNIDGTTAGASTGYGQVHIADGTVDLASKSLTLSGAYVPQAGDVFTIINNDDSNAISGTFNGLAEGASVTFNGVDLIISYVGGDGNDVTLSENSETNVNLTAGALSITDANGGTSDDTLTLTLVDSDSNLQINDPSNTLAGSGTGVVQVDANTVKVPVANITAGVTIDTKDGNDTVNLDAALSLLNGGDLTVTTDVININAALSATGSGAVTLNAAQNIAMNASSSITTVDGDITLNANTAGTTAGNFIGIAVTSATIQSSGTGNIALNGQGGADRNRGIQLNGATINTNSGTLTVTGTSAGTTEANDGVNISSSQISSQSGNITVTGNSTRLEGVEIRTSTITSTDGNIQIEGETTTSTSANEGLDISGNTVVISTDGTGNITLIGKSPSATQGNDGLRLETSARVTTSAGNITLTGEAGRLEGLEINDVTVSSTSGAITLNGTGTRKGIYIPNSSLQSTSGSITLNTDNLDISGTTTFASSDALVVQPKSATLSIGIGGGSGSLNISDAEISTFQDGFSSITIGDATNGTGEVNIDSATFTDPVTIAGGTIKDNSGTDITAATNAVTLKGNVAPGQSPGILNVTGNLSLADNDTLTIEIGGTTAGEAAANHDQINVVGTVTIGNNVTLSASAVNSYVPANGDEIVIINNDSNDAVSGTFNGLAEGATVTVGGQDMTLSYQGGTDNNDVVLTLTATVIDLSFFAAEVTDSDPETVYVTWETAAEIDNAGFNLHRATSADGPYLQINDALIAASGQPDAGERYSFIDTPGTGTFFYKLEDVDIHGNSSWHGPVSVELSTPTAVSLSDLAQKDNSKPYGLFIGLALLGLVALRKVRRR